MMDVGSARHRFVAPQQSLITLGPSATGGPYTAVFRVPIPDSRLRVKISTLFVPASGLATSGLSADLWLYETDVEAAGVTGIQIPTTNIEGTQAAPTAIPEAAGLMGYSREFVSAADYIVGRLRASPGGPGVGTWVLQTRYQPDAVRFTDREWNEIKNQCNPNVTIGPLRILS
jgi:hypothetical protein